MGELLNFPSPAFCNCEGPADSLGNCRNCGKPKRPEAMSDEEYREAFWNEERLYEIILPEHARAEADDLGAALLAAATLCEDADPTRSFNRALRRSLIITRDGRYDGLATSMAREGQRR